MEREVRILLIGETLGVNSIGEATRGEIRPPIYCGKAEDESGYRGDGL